MRPRIFLLLPSGAPITDSSDFANAQIDGYGKGEITPYVDVTTLSISQNMGQTIDTCTFEIKEQKGLDHSPWNKQVYFTAAFDSGIDVLIVDQDRGAGSGANSRAVPTLSRARYPDKPTELTGRKIIFAGTLTLVETAVRGINRLWSVTAQDYTMLLSKAYAVAVPYYNRRPGGDDGIIKDAFRRSHDAVETQASVVDPFDFNLDNFVEDGFLLKEFTPSRMPLSQVMDFLAGGSAFEWFVDYNKNLHFFQVKDRPVGFVLTDTTDATNDPKVVYSDFSHSLDSLQQANYIEVIGTFNWQQSEEFVSGSIGEAHTEANVAYTRYSFRIAWRPIEEAGEELPRVYINTGTDDAPIWGSPVTTVAVGTEGTAANANAVRVTGPDRYILVPAGVTINTALDKAIRIQGVTQLPIRTGQSAVSSRRHLGRYFQYRVYDESIQSLEMARLRLIREIRDRQYGETNVSVTVYDSDLGTDAVYNNLAVGSEVDVINSVMGGEYLGSGKAMFIDKIDIQSMGGGEATYTLTLQEPFRDIRPDRAASGSTSA